MGGWGSGGDNKTHDCTDKYKRLDSFYYGECIPLLKKAERDYYDGVVTWSDGGNIGVTIYPDKLDVYYSAGEHKIRESFELAGVPNNYGGADRYYFICPRCEKRCRYIYLHSRYFKCRKCAGLNYRSQQATKNMDLAGYKLTKFIREKFNESLSPYEAMRYRSERPKGMHRETYFSLTIKLHKLKIAYHDEFMKSAGGILGGMKSLSERLGLIRSRRNSD